MPNKTRMVRKPRKKRKQKEEPNILERLKKLSDDAPVVKMRGGSGFDFNDDIKDIKFKEP